MEKLKEESLFFKPKLNQTNSEQITSIKQMENKMIDKVFSTKNYEIFSSLDGNRIVNPLHVKKIADSMKIKVLFIPIIVNEEFQVIDGQHRLEARKQLGLEVPYIICPNYTLEDVHRANSNHKTWNAIDFLKGYAEAGVEDYKFLLEIYESYDGKLAINTILRLISPTEAKSYKINIFKEGRFKIEDSKKKFSIKIINDFYKFDTALGKKLTDAHLLIDAFRKIYIIEGFEIDRLIEKTSKWNSIIEPCASVSQYVYYIDKVYNYRSRDVFKLK